MTTPAEPTPDELRALAADAVQLADRIRVMGDRMRTGGDREVQRAAFRLDTVEGSVRITVREALQETASDLEKILEARGPNTCGIPWGVCPDHGNTLHGTGGRTECMTPRCGRTWTYDRVTLPCTEPITHHVVDAEGGTLDVCNGHALDCEKRLEGATVTRTAPLG
jgi:hypothetical protein